MIQPIIRMRQAIASRMRQRQRRVDADLVVGAGTLYEVPKRLDEQDIHCVMVVTSPGFVRRGVIASFTRDLLVHGVTAAVFSDVNRDPDIACAEQVAAFFRSHGCEAIVAIGGGSVIDCAKVAGALVARPKKQVHDFVGSMKIGTPIPYLVAVPTTAGTGSEASAMAVVVDEEQQRKLVISDFALIPDIAVLDANLLVDLSPTQTALAGMGALSHAVEAYLNRYGSRSVRANAAEAVMLIFKNLKASYDDGDNVKRREDLLMASYYAGVASSNAMTGYVDALSRIVSARYRVQQNLVEAVLLPVILREYGKAAESRLAQLAVMVGLHGETELSLATHFVAKVRSLAESLDIPAGLAEIHEADIPVLAAQAEAEANPACPVPEVWGPERFENVLHAVKMVESVNGGTSSKEVAETADAVSVAGAAAREEENGGAQLNPSRIRPGSAPSRRRKARIAATGGLTVAAAVAATIVAIRVRKK